MDSNFNLDTFFGFQDIAKTVQLEKKLKEKLFHMKELELTQRVVMHWDQFGLIDLPRSNNEEWRKFSFLDYVWLHIIQDLRNVGVPLEVIKKVKEFVLEKLPAEVFLSLLRKHLDEKEEKNETEEKIYSQVVTDKLCGLEENPEFSMLLFAVLISILSREPISLVIFEDGEAMFRRDNDPDNCSPAQKKKLVFSTYIKVSLTRVIKRFLTSEKSGFVLPKLSIIEKNEQQLLEIINSGDYEFVKITFKNRKVRTIELAKAQDTKERVVDIISENKYQDISIKVYNGTITKIVNTTTILFQ